MQNKETINCDIEEGVCSPSKTAATNVLSVTNTNNSSKVKLLYYYDALCGWCYGFSPVVQKIKETYQDEIEIEVISGGLFLGHRAGAVNEVAPHIKAGAFRSVEGRTGVKFGQPFLEDVFGEGKMILNSLSPTIALCIIKEKLPEQQVTFAGMLLSAVYSDGVDPTDINALADYAVKIGFDKQGFLTKMKDPKFETAAEKEFERFRQSPYSGMPALVAEKDGQQYPLSRGYADFEELNCRLKAVLAN
ncbi:MAG: DsbA family protein [Aureispira sp.]